jgi:hypothetical protein
MRRKIREEAVGNQIKRGRKGYACRVFSNTGVEEPNRPGASGGMAIPLIGFTRLD